MRMNKLGLNFITLMLSIVSILCLDIRAAVADDKQADSQGDTLSASTTAVSELPEITVKAHGIDQAQSFDEMHDSLNKVNILSQDQINQTPAKTVAQAAQQLPGVGVQHDTGEPRYIDIRGTDSNLNIITFNNTIIPSYDEAARSVDLDAIPAGMAGEMEVFKTILPDMDAQGVGGQMNLVPKSAFDYPGSFHELQVEGGYVPERSQATTKEDLTWGETLNLGGKTNLGILVAASYQYERFGIDDLENGYSDPADPPLVPNSVTDYDFRYYDYERDRGGIGANIDLSMDKENKLYANLMYSGYDEYRNPVWHTDIKNLDAEGAAVVNPDGSITIPDVQAAGVQDKKSMTNELTQFRTLATGVGGENNLGGFILDYKASFAYADQNVPYDFGYGFANKNNLTGSLTYNNTANNGNNPTINMSNMTGQNDPSLFTYTGSSDGTSTYNVNQYGLKADGKFDTPLGGDDTGTVKFGAAARLEYSVFNQVSLTSDQTGTLTMDQVLGSSSTPYYPGNIYNMGPLPSLSMTTKLLSGSNAYQGPYYQGDPIDDQGGDYNNWEDVYAVYAMDTIKSGKMEIMGGVRVEATHIQYNWWQSYAYDAFGNYTKTELSAPIAHTGTIDYTNALPSLGMKYTFNPQFVTRTNYSQTIARPTQNQYIPSFSLGAALDAQQGDSVINFQSGNPNLKPMISNNIDSSWEFYPAKGAILAADFFLKDIANYFATDYSKADSSGGVTNTVSYVNIPYSQIYGAEFQYQQQYTMLPEPLNGLGFRGSISFIGSSGEIVPNVYSELPSQSDLIWNTGIFYKKYGFTFDIGGSFTGKNLTTIGDPTQDNSPNIYYDDYFQIDAKAQYALSKDFTIYADGNNLNNANHRFYQGSPNFPIQNEYYGASFDGGVKVDF